MTKLLLVAAILAAGCMGDDAAELHDDQGPCQGLAENTCRFTSGCQGAYEIGAWLPEPQFLACLQVEGDTPAAGDCNALDHDACRTREDCSPGYWQDLGPNDAPKGDVYYKACYPNLESSS